MQEKLHSKSENDAYPSTNQHVNGLECPVCKAFIPVSVSRLLQESCVVCPACGLRLTINKSQSRKAMEALEKIDAAVRNLRDKESFKR